ncbi:MAG: hypothetical protein G01um101470_595 [Parcubacteria group bacterium Gr01-1014_70]|nr:MAG: hypothetical protein G01um101470_595 [Parcubacteria group bacterium Gr01-1014_70]
MPEQGSIQSLEEEIHALEEKLKERKALEQREEKEVFRDVLREHVESAKESVHAHDGEEEAAPVGGDVQSAQPFDYTAHAKQKADEIREKDHAEQTEALVGIALTKGILAAVRVARHLNNPHLLDDFHDMLVDEYYEKLIEARKLP